MIPASIDRFGLGTAEHTPEALAPFAAAGILGLTDLHVARWIRARHPDDAVMLAAALAVRALRLGNVCLHVARVRHTATVDEGRDDPGADTPVALQTPLPWPDVDDWLARLRASDAVAVDDDDTLRRPLRLVGESLYLDRSWRQERQVAADLARRAEEPVGHLDLEVLAAGLSRLYPGTGPDLQKLAAAAALYRRCSVLAGGPGTGKTTTAARILALVDEQAAAAGGRPPRVALAAPTGKAAARLRQSVNAEASLLDISAEGRARLAGLGASTLHRLLGRRPGPQGRFLHDRFNRLPYDVVVVDETSMVSLALLAALIDALRTETRLVLLGDPEQLASVEAGAVLGDIVGPATTGLIMTDSTRLALGGVTGFEVDAAEPPAGVHLGDGIVVLRRVHRYGAVIASLAEAIQVGDADETIHLLGGGHPELSWLGNDSDVTLLAPVRRLVEQAGREVAAAAEAGDGPGALAALATLRILCAHRRGPYGVGAWAERVEAWLIAALGDRRAEEAWYVGRPVLLTANDHELGLANGDVGVVIRAATGDHRVAFERHDRVVTVNPGRLRSFETVHALTIHKSQGSQFDRVVVVLPDPGSPLLTRQLFYTATTRARRGVSVVGSEAAVRAAVTTRITRASGLARRLWGPAWADDTPTPSDPGATGSRPGSA